jgi:predicted ribosome quality control (RQC) complex YloA/Tae2 family protein
MKKKTVQPAFKMSMSAFVTFFSSRLGFMRRDQEEFTRFGITPDKIQAVHNRLEAFQNIATDAEFLGSQMIATQAKTEAAEALIVAMGEVLTRASNKFGDNSARFRRFGVGSPGTLSDSRLSIAARRMIRSARYYFDDLQSEGLTLSIIDDLEQKRQAYDLAIEQQEDAISDRDIAAEDRLLEANALYAEMVKLCNTGKQIWATRNEAKYNDYVIYDTVATKAPNTSQKPASETTAPVAG